MRAWVYIAIYTLLTGAGKAQLVAERNLPQTKQFLTSPVKFFSVNVPGITLRPIATGQFGNTVCIRPEPEKLPFFCSMENKFRNRFHLYLKFRAGNDEMYRNFITTGHP